MTERNFYFLFKAESSNRLKDRIAEYDSPHYQWINLVCALMILVLSGSYLGLNYSQMKQASHQFKTAVYSDYLSLMKLRIK